MTYQQDSNLFSGLLFNKKQNDAVLCALVIFCTFVVLPNCIQLQRQAKYFATLSAEENIPCN